VLPTDPVGLEERSLIHTTPAQRVSPMRGYAVYAFAEGAAGNPV
jgi:hypothetical protein